MIRLRRRCGEKFFDSKPINRYTMQFWSLTVLLAATSLVGCQQKGPKVVNITGTVTHAGKPLAKVMVYFTPDTGRPSFGLTNEQGRFQGLYYTNSKSGVVIGS